MIDVARFARVAEELGTAEDIRRLTRLAEAADDESDRAHLRLLIVRVQEEIDPGPPDQLERTAKLALAAMRGTALRTSLRGWRARDPRRQGGT